jgi:flagellar hook-length control protein FliK
VGDATATPLRDQKSGPDGMKLSTGPGSVPANDEVSQSVRSQARALDDGTPPARIGVPLQSGAPMAVRPGSTEMATPPAAAGPADVGVVKAAIAMPPAEPPGPVGERIAAGSLRNVAAKPGRGQASGPSPLPQTATVMAPVGVRVAPASTIVLSRVDDPSKPATALDTQDLSALPLAQSVVTAGTVAMTPSSSLPDPKAVASQLADALVAARPNGAIEIALDPVELGRVRMILSPDGNAMAVVLSAERPETLDLLRRAIESLANDLRELGYGTLSFRFDQSGNRSDRPADHEQADRDAAAEPEIKRLRPTQSIRTVGFEGHSSGALQRLDIRV